MGLGVKADQPTTQESIPVEGTVPAETVTTEGTTEEATGTTDVLPEEPVVAKLSSKFDAITQHEKRLLAERRKFTEERNQFKSEQEKIAGLQKELQEKLELSKDPVAFFEKFGGLQDWMDKKLNPPDPVKTELEQLKERLAKFEEVENTRQSTAKEMAAKAEAVRYMETAKGFIDSGEDYSLFKHYADVVGQEPEEIVYATADEHYRRTGEILKAEEVLSQIMDSYGEKWKNTFGKTVADVEETTSPADVAPTISNGMVSATPTKADEGDGYDMYGENKEIAALVDKLKNI